MGLGFSGAPRGCLKASGSVAASATGSKEPHSASICHRAHKVDSILPRNVNMQVIECIGFYSLQLSLAFWQSASAALPSPPKNVGWSSNASGRTSRKFAFG
jgi:hypothetical protein